MKRTGSVCTFVTAVFLAAACSDDAALPTSALFSSGNGNAQAQGGHSHGVSMMDACDPTTFNAELGDGACIRNGGVTFDNFISQLTNLQRANAWYFAPGTVNALVGDNLEAVNRGGEVHTFTEVEAFGGGFVAELNGISGNPVPAPECLNFGAITFIPPGEKSSEEISVAGSELYQCCIHPWMRATVRARAKG